MHILLLLVLLPLMYMGKHLLSALHLLRIEGKIEVQ